MSPNFVPYESENSKVWMSLDFFSKLCFQQLFFPNFPPNCVQIENSDDASF